MNFRRVSPSVFGTGGVGGFTFRTNTAPLTSLLRWVKYESVNTQNDPDVLIPFVRAFGQDTWKRFSNHANDNSSQFKSSSQAIQQTWPGGLQDWAPLKPYTQDKREERGYNPDSPILVQSGQLKNLASNPFRDWRWGQRSIRGKSVNTPYGDHTSLSIAASINNGNFHASISGERVKNQTAYYNSRRKGGDRVGVPPRPFWGLEQSTLDRAIPSAMNRFMLSWGKRKTGTLT
jgi:hypothetical protein